MLNNTMGTAPTQNKISWRVVSDSFIKNLTASPTVRSTRDSINAVNNFLSNLAIIDNPVFDL